MSILPSPLLFLSFTPIDIKEMPGGDRMDSVISCLYTARTIFQRKNNCLHIPRPGVNQNLRKCVLRRTNSNRRDRVMGCIRFIPRMILFLRYPPLLQIFYGRRLTLMLLKGILAHAGVQLYDTCADGARERGV